MKKISKKINVDKETNKYYALLGSIAIAILVGVIMLSISKNTKQQLVQKGMLEYTEITTGYIVKKEDTITKDQTKVLVPVIAEGARVAKGDIIATYKGEEYKNYEEKLLAMDKEILERMQDLPVVYSSEIDAIESTIYTLVKQSIGQTSYNKMQEYKKKINTNINKRASIIGELSPDGAEIKKLIEERNKYEQEAKKSNDNILATMPGIVSYSADGLETTLEYVNIKNIDYNTIKGTVLKQMKTDTTKLKIVSNYEAYVIIKANIENEKYIAEGYNYRLRLIEQDGFELLAKAEKVNVLEDDIEVYFKITNGIENIVNLREIEVEVVWDYSSGLIVPINALNKYEDKDVWFVTTVNASQYVDIPVQLRLQNENCAIVKNYTLEELESVGIQNSDTLKLYDRVIITNQK